MKRYLFIFVSFTIFNHIPSVALAQSVQLRRFSKTALQEDFDLLVSALKEAHTGLYWYQTPAQFDSICTSERGKLQDQQNSYDFFRIASRIVAATREGHCRISSSKDIGRYFNNEIKLIPISVKFLANSLYILNDIGDLKIKGNIIQAIDGMPIDEVISRITSSTANVADGYIQSGKIRQSIDYSGLSNYYADFIGHQNHYTLTLLDPSTGEIKQHELAGVSPKAFNSLAAPTRPHKVNEPISFRTSGNKGYLAIHSFRHTLYDENGDEQKAFANFKRKIDGVFKQVLDSKLEKLVIDIRQNGGGTEGYEDYVLSYLAKEPYTKYRYVQTNTLNYSFLDFTQYREPEKRDGLRKDLEKEFYATTDGRLLRKPGFMDTEPSKPEIFSGKLYALISGKTYSGGSEFAALLKQLTDCTFIGEETGGGFYGQTSGFSLNLLLPHTEQTVRIPIMKFAVNVADKTIPEGRGVLPDIPLEPTIKQYLAGEDAVLLYTNEL